MYKKQVLRANNINDYWMIIDNQMYLHFSNLNFYLKHKYKKKVFVKHSCVRLKNQSLIIVEQIHQIKWIEFGSGCVFLKNNVLL